MTNTIFNTIDNQSLINRINNLNQNAQPIWGKMTASQMILHCQKPMDVAEGKLLLKQTFIGFIFGKMILKKLLNGTTLDKNSPTDKGFIITNSPNFEIEQQKLLAQINDFAIKGASIIKISKHPFFGYMTTDQWGTLFYKHLDHHLKQFGV